MQKLLRVISVLLITSLVTSPPAFSGGGFSNSGGSSGGSVSDDAYGAGWNGVTDEAPSQNAVYDQVEQVRSQIINMIHNRRYDAVVTVSSTISAALASITDNSAFKRYLLYVPNGTYTENIAPKDYVDIVGESKTGVILKNSGDASPFSNVSDANGYHMMLANMTLQADTSSTTYAIHFDDSSQGIETLRPKVDGSNASSETILYNLVCTAAHKAGIGIGLYARQRLYIVDVTSTGGDGSGSIISSGVFAHNSATSQTRPSGLYLINVTATAGAANDPGFEYRNLGSGQPDFVQVIGGSFTGHGTGAGVGLINSGSGAGESYYFIDPLTSGTVTVSAGTRLTHFQNIPIPKMDDPWLPEYLGPKIIAGASSIGSVTQTGSGLSDITLGGTFVGNSSRTLRIKITTAAAPDKFDWSVDGGTTWAATAVPITGSAQSLATTGVTVTFAATTGHTLNDYWESTLTPPTGIVSTTGGFQIGQAQFLNNWSTDNLALGLSSVSGANTAVGLTALGNSALAANTTGAGGTAVGASALTSNTTGGNNTSVGYHSQFLTSTGADNTSVGYLSLDANTSGNFNTAIGWNALGGTQTVDDNTAVGANALFTSTGANNTAMGRDAGKLLTSASNTLIGKGAGDTISSGGSNTCVGSTCLDLNQTGTTNTCVGMFCLKAATGNGNVALGYDAGLYETGANSFYVNNQDRTDTAGDMAKSLMYGVFASTAAAQRLKINANFIVEKQTSAQTIAAGNTITANACGSIKEITSAGAVTTDTTNTFTAPSTNATTGNQACIMRVVNIGANNITLDNNANFKSAGGADVVMTPDDVVEVFSTGSVWYQSTPLQAN